MTLESITWIGLHVEQPGEGLRVLIYQPELALVQIGYHCEGQWRDVGGRPLEGDVTHWAELPTGPNP